MKPEKCFYVEGSKGKRPKSRCTIYVDGTAGADFREDLDIELSHWIPNRTEERYKAGTSTEICFKFLEANKISPYDLVVNNHLDIDGLLSVFVLAYPTIALQYREVLSNASKAGDFWAWSEGRALTLFQELTLLYRRPEVKKADLQRAYEICFDAILKILKAPKTLSPIQEILEKQFALIDQGKIERQEVSPRFVTYYVPKAIVKGKAFLQIPSFNEPVSEHLPFWPQVRNRLDEEKIQLIAVENDQGIHFDLWYPGYVWADTRGLWRPPGLILPQTMSGPHRIDWPQLSKVIQELNDIERGPCRWQLFSGISFSGQKNPRGFPIVAATLDQNNEQCKSYLSLERVSGAFGQLF